MTQLRGRVLEPPKLKLGDGGHVMELTPTRHDRQWNLLNSHVTEGAQIKRWALISFGGSPEQRSTIPKFINQLSQRCEQLGIRFNKTTVIAPLFEQMKLLNDVSSLECKLSKIHESALCDLQLLICVMEKKHRGYADLKRIAETGIGVVSQCSLKINAKLGGSNVVLYNTIPRQIPRIFTDDEPSMFMGADDASPSLDDSSPSVAAVELRAIRTACRRFPGYDPAITFTVVQKRHHTRLLLKDKTFGDENIPPGTVVDTVITHRGSSISICVAIGDEGTSRPTHYHVLWDDNSFRSDEFQKLIHDLCYTFVRCTKPISLVPPAYYAHLAAYRGRLYLERAESSLCCTPQRAELRLLRLHPCPSSEKV
ncbi:hypothetical protein HPP92_012948 [Vanilla planifolia]|uniref:Piwi domain-containing protein n=1 Tax=Vanilla planifolia TaxID=51239 RepID=A0A835UWF9_VANPL|nr:hypothetical protein HPP92_013413 [Vanilla planifolia]KAG0478229.1 hypothetical protein HPP92_012948 [Vanilla planifolia]